MMELVRWLVALMLVGTPLPLCAQESAVPTTDPSSPGWQLAETSGKVEVTADAAQWMAAQSDQDPVVDGKETPIGEMIEIHQLQNTEAEQIIRNANLAIKGARKSEQDFKIFWAALIQYYKDTGTVPSPQQGLEVLLIDPKVEGWKGPYLDKDSNLLDPYGKPYLWNLIRNPTGRDIFELRSGGPDGFPGNDDDSKDTLYRWKLEKLAKEPSSAGQ